MSRHGCQRCSGPQGPAPFVLPGASPSWAPPRPVRTRHVLVDVALDFERRRVDGRCELTVAAVRDGVARVELDAVALEIRSVRAGGADARFHHDGRVLAVELPAPLAEGAELVLAVEYGTQPRRGVWFVGPDELHPARPWQAWTQGQDEDARHWFPCLDAPHQKATVEVRARVPKRMAVVSNGRKLSDVVEGETRTVHHRLDQATPPYLVTLVAGELARTTDRWRDVELEYFVPPDRAEDAARTFERTPRMIELFSELTGVPYPYPKYAQVVVAEFIFGGMENTSATTLTDATLHDEKAHGDFSSEPLTSHELAHQWFGDLLTCREWPHGWLNEGFATYLEVLWKEHVDGIDEADQVRADDLDLYLKETSDRYVRPIVAREYHAPIDVFDRHLYEKGSLVLHELRRRLGDGLFRKAIRHYVRKHQGGNVETVDLQRAVEEATGHALDRFFDQYVLKPGHPELSIAVAYDADAAQATVHVKQTQDTSKGTPLFELPLDVRFAVGGAEHVRTLRISRAEERFVLPLPGRPEQAVVDPHGDALATLSVDKPPALWLAELASAREGRARAAAAKALGKDGSAPAIEALEKALRADPFWGVRAAAAAALGGRRTEAGKDALLRALPAESHPKARRAVVRALGEQRGDDRVAAALARALDGDATWLVEGEAARSLGATRAPSAFASLEAALPRARQQPGHMDAVLSGVLEGLGKLRDDRALPLLLRHLRRDVGSFARRAAVAALAEAGRGKREVTLALEDLLDDADFRVKAAAASALGELGDDHAAGALSRCESLDGDGRVRRACREALRAIREGHPPPKELASLRDEVDGLKSELAKLREELARRP